MILMSFDMMMIVDIDGRGSDGADEGAIRGIRERNNINNNNN